MHALRARRCVSYWNGAASMIELVYSLVFGLLALATQAQAVYTYLLWQPAAALDPLLMFLFWQAIVALATALFGITALPRRDRRAHRSTFCSIFALCMFIPVAGPLLFFSLILVSRIFPATPGCPGRHAVFEPLMAGPAFAHIEPQGGGLRARLARLHAPQA
jgi:hypothetical protein